jgi:glycerate 2-kinase
MAPKRELLLSLYQAAVEAAHPRAWLGGQLPEPPRAGRLIVIAAGKAGAAMGAVVEAHYGSLGQLGRVLGVVTAPYGYAATLGHAAPRHLAVVEGRHPTPDQGSLAAAETALRLAASATTDNRVVVLLSGGASSLWAAPVAGISLDEKTALTRGLLKSGADIHEMNTVRRHLSRIKGGRLAKASRAVPILTLAVSDVPGDDPATIGSGPTVPDPTTLAEAQAIVTRRAPRMAALGLPVPDAVARALADPANETPKPGDPAFAQSTYRIVATPADSLAAAAALARRKGYEVHSLGDRVTGEARDIAFEHARMAVAAKAAGRRVAILSGGELEVTVRNRSGRGGRSQEYALALAVALEGQTGISALAADTDGIDGGEGLTTDPAGAIVDWETVSRASARGLDARRHLEDNDATPILDAIDALLVTGPTHTNVNDFRAILVDPSG